LESGNGTQETQKKYSDELHRLANKFEARIRTDFHAQFAEIRDRLTKEFTSLDLQKVSNEVFLKLLERFVCLGVVVIGDHLNDPMRLENLLVEWIRKQVVFTSQVLEGGRKMRTQLVHESTKIDDVAEVVKVDTTLAKTPTPITKGRRKKLK